MYIYIYIHIYIHIYIYIYTYIYTYICIYIYIYMYITYAYIYHTHIASLHICCVCLCVCASGCACLCAYIYIYTHLATRRLIIGQMFCFTHRLLHPLPILVVQYLTQHILPSKVYVNLCTLSYKLHSTTGLLHPLNHPCGASTPGHVK